MQNKEYDIKKRSYQFAIEIIKLLENLPRDYVVDAIGKQVLRSATSIGANIIEAQASPSRKDFSNFYNHALKSANETKYWLGLLRDSGKVSENKVAPVLNEVHELANILASCLLSLRGKRTAP